MATSDNVVRSGLTPKFKDVDTLVSMLTYNYGSANDQILNGKTFKTLKHTIEYNPPIEEFSILKTSLKAGEEELVESLNGPSIILVTQGSGQINDDEVMEKSCYFVEAHESIKIQTDKELTIYRAYCTIDYQI